MTNSPIFDQQLALNDYWKNIGGTTFLPGTNRAADRFVRASFYINAIPKTDDILLLMNRISPLPVGEQYQITRIKFMTSKLLINQIHFGST